MKNSITLCHNNMKTPTVGFSSALVLLFTLAGCVAVPKDEHASPLRDASTIKLASDIKLGNDAWPQAQWWRQYGDAQLDKLIRQAMSGSPSLQAASARVHAAQAALSQSEAAESIGFRFNAGANQQRYSATGLFPAPIGGSSFKDFSLQVQAGYDFDWWGKRRALIAAVAGEANARRAEYAQAEQTLAASIAQTYFNLQSTWVRQANLKKMAELQQAVIDDRNRRIAHGLAASEERQLAQRQLSELQRQFTQLDSQAKQQREALRALTGGDVGMAELKPASLPAIPHALPANLGIGLLARRPDLQAARWRVEASLGRVGAAQAAFYPDINLTGSFGLDSLSLSHLLEAGSRTYFIGPALSLPIFNSRTLKSSLEAARSERNEIVADYNQSVLNALYDVSQAGAALQGVEREIGEQGKGLALSEDMLRGKEAKLKQGLADNAAVLDARMVVLQENDRRTQLENRRLLAEVALNKALGGGYENDGAQPGEKQAEKLTGKQASLAQTMN